MLYNEYRPCRLLLAVLVVSLAHHATSFQSLRSECYTLDKDNFLYDFTDWIGKEFQYTEAQDGSTYTLRFCKDMQVRSGQSIVNYGRFSPEYSSAQDTTIAFVHEYRFPSCVVHVPIQMHAKITTVAYATWNQSRQNV